MGIPPYVTQHFAGAKDAYQHGVMAGMNDNIERLTGQKPMSVGEFARAKLGPTEPKGE
jgi:NAD(P)H dehydrogenase (quinone)